jgi:hypothetical protein
LFVEPVHLYASPLAPALVLVLAPWRANAFAAVRVDNDLVANDGG